MTQPLTSPPTQRVHEFFFSTSRHVFLHPVHGCVFVREPIKLGDAAKYQLSPVTFYALMVPGTSISCLYFSDGKEPVPFSRVLLQAWEKAEGLRGYPDVLKINRHLLKACPSLASSPRAALRVFNEATCGGDVAFCVEAIPDKGPGDPRWRYVVFQGWSGEVHIILVARDSEFSATFGAADFEKGAGPSVIPSATYQDLVASCDRACADPAVNRLEILEFLIRSNELFQQLVEDAWRR